MVKNLPAVQETWVQSLGRQDPLENEMTTHSTILAWRIPWADHRVTVSLHKMPMKNPFSDSNFHFLCLKWWLFTILLFLIFIWFWLCWVFLAVSGFPLATRSEGYSLVAVRELLTAVASLSQSTSSRVCGLSSCGTWTELPRSVWHRP